MTRLEYLALALFALLFLALAVAMARGMVQPAMMPEWLRSIE